MTGCRKRCTKKKSAAAAEVMTSFGPIKWPFQDLSDLQLAVKKLVHISFWFGFQQTVSYF